MKIIKHVCFLFFALLAGCNDPKIDTTSDDSMKASIQKVRESLPDTKQKEFDDAMKLLAFRQMDIRDLFAQGTAGRGGFEGKVKDSINGKTGKQVIDEAERIRIERKEREYQQALEEIRELETKRVKSENAREELKKFQVIRSRFYMHKGEYGRKQPIIELTLKNGTGNAISRAYFEGTIASPGRSVPWYKNTFNYSISGGLEPNEEATWSLAPNMFSDWGKVDAPADAVFTVTVEQLDGSDEQLIYSTRVFNEHDSERLKELKEKYGIEQQ